MAGGVKSAVVGLFGELLQQPTWLQVRHIRKCSHRLPLFRHSSQPSALGEGDGIVNLDRIAGHKLHAVCDVVKL
jgi:hypothetical protein